MNPSRRRAGLALAGLMGLSALSMRPGVAAQDKLLAKSSAKSPATVRMLMPARDTVQSLALLGVESGIFSKHGIDLRMVAGTAADVGPAEGLGSGNWQFAQLSPAQLVAQVLAGRDVVMIMTTVEPNKAGFIAARRDLRSPEQLSGVRIGVAALSGGSAASAKAVLDWWRVSAQLVPLGSLERVYQALAEGRVDAAFLPVELSFRGRALYSWNLYQGVLLGVPGGLATTRGYIAQHRAEVAAVVRGMVDAIHFFKTRRDLTLPLLQRHLAISEPGVAASLHEFYEPLLRTTPRPSLFFGLDPLRQSLLSRYPAAAGLQAQDLIDASFVDELERSGYIATLYRS